MINYWLPWPGGWFINIDKGHSSSSRIYSRDAGSLLAAVEGVTFKCKLIQLVAVNADKSIVISFREFVRLEECFSISKSFNDNQ